MATSFGLSSLSGLWLSLAQPFFAPSGTMSALLRTTTRAQPRDHWVRLGWEVERGQRESRTSIMQSTDFKVEDNLFSAELMWPGYQLTGFPESGAGGGGGGEDEGVAERARMMLLLPRGRCPCRGTIEKGFVNFTVRANITNV